MATRLGKFIADLARRLRPDRRPRATTACPPSSVFCPCCGSSSRAYQPLPNTDNGICEPCGSYHRHRLLMLFLERRARLEMRPGPTRILHVAPEPTIARRLRDVPDASYVGIDRRAPGYHYPPGSLSALCDLQGLPFADDSFDVIVCNHVFEHLSDDLAAMREVRRVLRPRGWAILMVPLTLNVVTLEDPSITDPEERILHYGQFDHVRLYGQDYPLRLRRAGFGVRMIDYASEFDEAATQRFGLLQGFDDTIVFCRKRRSALERFLR